MQREQAFRFGVNLVMYALTGNYKADQVHVPAIAGAARTVTGTSIARAPLFSGPSPALCWRSPCWAQLWSRCVAAPARRLVARASSSPCCSWLLLNPSLWKKSAIPARMCGRVVDQSPSQAIGKRQTRTNRRWPNSTQPLPDSTISKSAWLRVPTANGRRGRMAAPAFSATAPIYSIPRSSLGRRAAAAGRRRRLHHRWSGSRRA